MTVQQVLTDAWRAYKGKSTTMPDIGTDKWNDLLGILNRKQREWWSDNTVDWPSLFQLSSNGPLVAGTQSYTVASNIIRPSDYVILQDANNNKKYITVVKPNIISQYVSGCYFSGYDMLNLTFITTIDASLNGMTLIIPAYIQPTDLAASTDTVVVDDPNWCVYAVASELARNDYAKEEQFPNLNGIANTLYQQMVDNANANSLLQPNSVPNNMPQPNSFSGAYPYNSNGLGTVF
jgi:hypothetical protein